MTPKALPYSQAIYSCSQNFNPINSQHHPPNKRKEILLELIVFRRTYYHKSWVLNFFITKTERLAFWPLKKLIFLTATKMPPKYPIQVFFQKKVPSGNPSWSQNVFFRQKKQRLVHKKQRFVILPDPALITTVRKSSTKGFFPMEHTYLYHKPVILNGEHV